MASKKTIKKRTVPSVDELVQRQLLVVLRDLRDELWHLREARRITSRPDCPWCGKQMIPMRRRRDNKFFWGCSEFPACHGSRSM